MHNFTDQIMSFDKACDLVKTAHNAGAYKAHWARISWACEKSGVAAIHTAIWSSVRCSLLRCPQAGLLLILMYAAASDYSSIASSLSHVAYCLGQEIVSRNALSLRDSISYGIDESRASSPATGSSTMFSFRTRTRMRPNTVWIEILAFARCSVRRVLAFIRTRTMRKSCCFTSVLELRPVPRCHDPSLRSSRIS